MNETSTLIILAGGASRRMGQPKHLLATRGGTLIEHIGRRLSPQFAETLLVGRDEDLIPDGMRFVQDACPVRSPLVGIYSGLLAARTDTCIIIGCDMPFVVPSLVQELAARCSGVDVVVPVVNGFCEPLLAAYRRSCIPAIETALDEGRLKVTSIYRDLTVREVPEEAIRRIDPELTSFTNLNTPKQLGLLARL